MSAQLKSTSEITSIYSAFQKNNAESLFHFHPLRTLEFLLIELKDKLKEYLPGRHVFLHLCHNNVFDDNFACCCR